MFWIGFWLLSATSPPFSGLFFSQDTFAGLVMLSAVNEAISSEKPSIRFPPRIWWKWCGVQLKTWLRMVKQDIEPIIVLRIYGVRWWNRDWLSVDVSIGNGSQSLVSLCERCGEFIGGAGLTNSGCMLPQDKRFKFWKISVCDNKSRWLSQNNVDSLASRSKSLT